jgi:hypothetical protein
MPVLKKPSAYAEGFFLFSQNQIPNQIPKPQYAQPPRPGKTKAQPLPKAGAYLILFAKPKRHSPRGKAGGAGKATASRNEAAAAKAARAGGHLILVPCTVGQCTTGMP